MRDGGIVCAESMVARNSERRDVAGISARLSDVALLLIVNLTKFAATTW